MKTTIDIPEPLYKRAKIRAVEQGQTLKDLVLNALQRELTVRSRDDSPAQSFVDRRKLLPSYEAALNAGAFSGGSDSTVIVSEDRSSRENALL